jgi:hypothetical protein
MTGSKILESWIFRPWLTAFRTCNHCVGSTALTGAVRSSRTPPRRLTDEEAACRLTRFGKNLPRPTDSGEYWNGRGSENAVLQITCHLPRLQFHAHANNGTRRKLKWLSRIGARVRLGGDDAGLSPRASGACVPFDNAAGTPPLDSLQRGLVPAVRKCLRCLGGSTFALFRRRR